MFTVWIGMKGEQHEGAGWIYVFANREAALRWLEEERIGELRRDSIDKYAPSLIKDNMFTSGCDYWKIEEQEVIF